MSGGSVSYCTLRGFVISFKWPRTDKGAVGLQMGVDIVIITGAKCTESDIGQNFFRSIAEQMSTASTMTPYMCRHDWRSTSQAMIFQQAAGTADDTEALISVHAVFTGERQDIFCAEEFGCADGGALFAVQKQASPKTRLQQGLRQQTGGKMFPAQVFSHSQSFG